MSSFSRTASTSSSMARLWRVRVVLMSASFEAHDAFAHQQRRGAWGQRNCNLVLGGVGHEFEDVRSLQGSPPVKTNTGISIAAISSMRRFASVVLSSNGFARRLRTGATVHACQVARLRGLPDSDERPLIEVAVLVDVASLIPRTGSTSNTMADRRAPVCDVSHLYLTFGGNN